MNEMIIFKDSKGLTIIELLLTLAIIGFVIAALYTFYLTGLRGWQRGIEQMEAQQSARIAMDKIISEVRYAHELSLDEDGKAVRFKTKDNIRTLRFRLINNEVVFDSCPDGEGSYFHTKIALNVTGLTFSLGDNQLLTVTITAETGSNSIVLTSSVRPRNLPGGD